MARKRDGSPEKEHEFGQNPPHKPPFGCTGVSAYVPIPVYEAFYAKLKERKMSIVEFVNRKIVEFLLDDRNVELWPILRLTAQQGVVGDPEE